MKTFHHTVVCVTTFTMPVHLHGTNFAPFLLRTRRCYDTETSAILLLLKRALHDILFEKFWRGHRFIKFDRNQRL